MTIRIHMLIPVLILGFAQIALAQDRVLPSSNEQIQVSFSPLVKKVAPAVVNIYTKRTVSIGNGNPFMNDPFFGQFFNEDVFGGRMRKKVESALGSGVIIDPSGLVVTNAHVIAGAEEITVGLSDGREFSANLALSDKPSDLAILRLETKGEPLPNANLRASETLEVGDIVLAIGNPFGVGQTVTSGIVSAKARSSLNVNDFNFFIQTDAAINPGNSGGPLVALDGGIVGINTAIYSRSGGSNGIGFAIPSEMVASVIAAEKMGRSGEEGVVRPWLGISAQGITSDIAESLGMKTPAGVLVAGIHKASPLHKAGIQVGDVILAINGHKIRDPQEHKFRMATVPLGQYATFEISREGTLSNHQVLAMAPPDDPPANKTTLEGNHPLSGSVVANINPMIAHDLDVGTVEEGVVIVSTGAYLARFMSAGDVVMEVNHQPVKTVTDLKSILSRPTQSGWSLVINSKGRLQQISIR